MGVKDLWQLLSPIGRRVSIETLEGKILAIDTSIWITQFIKAMRDEDGQTPRNAHILGTMRRILKLLYHRIRPVFVFDGTAPALKRRTLQARRRRRESVDRQLQRLDHRSLVARMRKDILKRSKTANSGEPVGGRDENSGSQSSRIEPDAAFVSSFVAMPSKVSAASCSSLSSSSSSSSCVPNNVPERLHPSLVMIGNSADNHVDMSYYGDDAVDWEDGYSELPQPKPLDSLRASSSSHSSHQNHRRHVADSNVDASDVDEDLQWDLPLDSEAIDISVLAALPTQMRKDLIEETRRRERARKRSDYLPVASDPELYSQTQIANFLKTSKLNKKISDIQAIAEGRSEGIRIAAQSNRKYILSKTAGADVAAAGGVVENEVSNALYAPSDGEFSGQIPNDVISSMYSKGDRNWFCDACFTRNNIQSPRCEVCDARNPQDMVEDVEVPDNLLSENIEVMDASIALRSTNSTNIASDAFDTVDWESQSSASEQETADAQDCDDSLIIFEPLSKSKEPSKLHSDETSVESCADIAIKLASPFIPDDVHQITEEAESFSVGPSNSEAREVYIRAVQTASRLTDWAGRAVHRAVKEHLGESDSGNLLLKNVDKNLAVSVSSTAGTGSSFGSTVESDDNTKPITGRGTQSIASNYEFEISSERSDDIRFKLEEDVSAYDDVASRQLRDKLTRDANVVTNEMVEDVMELLRVVGLPFLVAPSEAEAQCAALERLGLVDGVVTEDSDSFLFGAKRIYKNFFQDNKFVEVYDIEDIERELSVDRDCLIAMAHLLGSDYVDGIRGVGIVNASEIVQTFMPRPQPEPDRILRQRTGPDETLLDPLLLAQAVQSSAESVSSGLGMFRKWLDDDSQDSDRVQHLLESLKSRGDFGDDITERVESIRYFDDRHRGSRTRWRVPDTFPDRVVSEAYLKPQVNLSTGSFSWPVPQLAAISDFCVTRLGWTDAEVSAKVAPVVARCLQPTEAQRTMYSYYTKYQDNSRFAKIRSKRLQEALFGTKVAKKAKTAGVNDRESARKRTRRGGDAAKPLAPDAGAGEDTARRLLL